VTAASGPDRRPTQRRIELPLGDRAFLLLLAPLTALGAMSQNMYVPVVPLLRAELGLSVAAANTTGSFALAAYAVGLLFGGTLSDRLGRRRVMLVGNAVFLVGSAGCALAPSLGWLVTARVIQALGSSTCMVTARAMVGDVYPRENMARMLAFLTMVMVIAPTLSPIVGGFVGDHVGWRGVFWVLGICGVPPLLLSLRHLPETRSAAARAALAGGGARAMWQQGRTVFGDRAFVGASLQTAIVMCSFLIFVWSVPHTLRAQSLPLSTFGLWNLVVAVGYFAGNGLVTRFGSRYSMAGFIRAGLWLQFTGALLGWALAESGLSGPWITPLMLFLPMAILAFGQGLALPNLNAAAIALHPEASGTASSLLGFGQQFAAAIAVQCMGLFVLSSPEPMMRCILATVVVSMLLLYSRRFRPAGVR
jgi:MFS transporter, DHA1 family, multidrug resistance protein